MYFFKSGFEIVAYYLSGLFKRKNNRIVFGAWDGKQWCDNSKYMIEFLHKNNLGNSYDYQLIWIGNENVKNQIPLKYKFVRRDSISGIYYCLTCKYAFFTHTYFDLSSFNIFNGATLIQLWHGVGIKKLWIKESKESSIRERIRAKVRLIIRQYHYFICSSEANLERNLLLFKEYGINENKILKSGQPRNDILINHNVTDKDKILKKFKNKFENDFSEKRIILYTPTYRKHSKEEFSFFKISEDEYEYLSKRLALNNCVLFEKRHNATDNSKNKNKKDIFDITSLGNSFADIQELMIIADIMITDYSSSFLDFLLLDKPIIHFIYDFDEYLENDNGIYYKFEDIAAGDVVHQYEELIISIENNLMDPDKNKDQRNRVKNKMMEYEKGESCKTIAKELKLI